MPAPEVILTHDHRELDALAQDSFTAFSRVDAVTAHTALDKLWMRLAVHIRAEHKALFPALVTAPEEIQVLIQRLRVEHDVFMTTLARILTELRRPAADLPALAATFSEMHDLLRAHNELEEAKVYPLAGAAPDLAIRIAGELAFLPERYGK